MSAQGRDATGVEVEDLAAVEAESDPRLSPDGSLIAVCVSGPDIEADRERNVVRIQALASGAAEPLDFPGRAPRWSPDGRSLAFVSNPEGPAELLLFAVAERSPRSLAGFPGPAGAPAWSPAGDRIAISAGADAGALRIAIVDAETGSVSQLPGAAGDDIAPSWSPDGARLAFSRAPRDPGEEGPSGAIVVIRPDTGEETTLDTGLAFAACPSWSPDGRHLAFYGTRDPRLGLEDPALRPWVMAAEGGPARAIGEVSGIAAGEPPEGPLWSPDGSLLYFREARRGDVNLVAASVEEPGEARTLVEGRQVTAASAGGGFVFSASTADDPGSAFALGPPAGEQRLTPTPPRLAGRIPALERRSFPSPHGYSIDGWLQGRREGSTQPLLVSMHGGPHGFAGSGFQGGHFHRSVLASRGWLVLTLNPSGSGSYGEEFADSIRGGWGERDLPEYLAAVDALIAEGIADPDRLAVAGYSYGGYLAAWAISHSDRFKAAAIGAPISDLAAFRRGSDIGSWWTPWEIGKGAGDEDYARLSPITYAERIATPTLILHGEADRRCPIGQGEALEAAIAAAGAPVELVRYPGAGHLFYARGRPSQRLDYNRRIVAWIESHVPGKMP